MRLFFFLLSVPIVGLVFNRYWHQLQTKTLFLSW